MAKVLVTGGSGNLGRHTARALVARGHAVRILVHESTEVPRGVEVVRGDVLRATDVAEAVDGVDVVVHAVVGRGRSAVKTEVVGTRRVLEAVNLVGAHLVYPSKVGVDRHRLAYYEAKWRSEQSIVESGGRWSILRATQFHDHIEDVLSAPVFFRVPGLAFQPVDVREFAARIAAVCEAGPSGRVVDFGGPELLGIGTLAERREQITGRSSRLVKVPRLGALRDFASGVHLCPAHRNGRITWDEWLERDLASA